jgi:hypothetical protein
VLHVHSTEKNGRGNSPAIFYSASARSPVIIYQGRERNTILNRA